ncbi:response regulator transcription factor [Paenibacillus elgii]|uniref:response regulator transcription factor n=1 Tax=Paenibacillus elgii TaxID=189691 RepID=UPI00204199B2|nr:LuxR C-terminal-related transcriptional regulator [Paenibacillus elgii]MCM3273789.1 LuxR C-terminal-related transcriptional regulator [Paenibacillus elgii]
MILHHDEKTVTLLSNFTKEKSLTDRESEIVILVSLVGLSNKELAQKLYITEKTVNLHMTNILKKTGAKFFSSINCSNCFLVIQYAYLTT